MTPETLHDAITLLPEDLLTGVDRLRQKKRIPWKSVAAVAACLCLVVGLWFMNPGAKNAADSANGAGASPEMDGIVAESQYGSISSGILVEVLSVGEDQVQVRKPLPEESSDVNISIQIPSLRLTFENLEQPPRLQPGQTIRIYFEPEDFDENSLMVKPYKIEIVKEETK